ncbi:MAG: AbrB/MazE/SpoVT family DNA-binding domain-containing protein [Oscillospiraceae bacterium]|nr:AbrB/MazE/SpoVT family DNA-binding domain-containing protein [Oscillospiraceae bacterium]
MKSTGIVRKIDELGRIVLPAEMRRIFNINEKDAVEIFTKDDMIVLKKYDLSCVFCGTTDDLKVFKDKNVCPKCAKELKSGS